MYTMNHSMSKAEKLQFLKTHKAVGTNTKGETLYARIEEQSQTEEQEPITGVEIAMLNGLMGYCENRCNTDFVLYAYEYFSPAKIAKYMVLYGYVYESALEWIMQIIVEEEEPAPPLTYEELETIEELKTQGILYNGNDVEPW